MWQKIARFILKNRVFLLILIVAITFFMGIMATQVQMSYKQSSVLPAKDSTLVAYQKFSKEFGKEGDIIFFTVEDTKFWQLNHLQSWIKIGNKLNQLDGVGHVMSVVHNSTYLKKDKTKRAFIAEKIFKHPPTTQKEIDSLKSRLYNIPFYEGKLYDKKKNAYMMLLSVEQKIINSKARIPFIKQLKKEIEEFATQQGLKVRITGLPYIRVETAGMIKKEMILFLALSLLITALVLYLFFRSFRIMLFSLVIVTVSAIWAIGIMGILNFEITLLTAMIPPLLIVIGIPNCIFLINKYHAEYIKHGNKIMALQRVIMRVGNAIFLTNLTTAAGFATFIITSSTILVEFGIVASINILFLFFFSIVMIPCIFSFLPVPKARHTKHLNYKYINNFLQKLLHIITFRRKWVYALTFSLLGFVIFGLSKIESKGFVIDDLPHDGNIMQNLKYFEKNFGGIMPLEFVVDTKKPKGIMQLQALRDIEKFSNEVQKLSYLSAPLSLIEIAKLMNQAFYNGANSKYQLPTNRTGLHYLLTYAKNSADNSNNKMLQSYVDSTAQRTRLTFYMQDIGTNKMMEANKDLQQIIDKTLPSKKYQTTITGSGVVFYKGTRYLIRNLLMSLSLAVLLISGLMAFMFSSKRMVVIALIPNIIPLLVTAALMGFLDIPIKASTILVFSIAFGISVDDTIHFLAKYRLDLALTKWDIKKSVKMALLETGQSMLYSSIILFLGFLIFSFSEFGGIKALGTLVSFTLFTAMFSNLVLLPSLLMSLEKHISNKKFKRSSVPIYRTAEEEENENL